LAQKAEVDSVFLADTLAAGDDVARAPRTWLDPLTGVTSHIGLIVVLREQHTIPLDPRQTLRPRPIREHQHPRLQARSGLDRVLAGSNCIGASLEAAFRTRPNLD